MGKILIPINKVHIRTIMLDKDLEFKVAEIDKDLAEDKDFINYLKSQGVKDKFYLQK